MKNNYSLGNRLVALALCVIMVLGMLPAQAIAQETTPVAKIGDTTYGTLEDALAAVPTGTNQTAPTEATTVVLLQDVAYAFDVGNSTGSKTMNLVLDLNDKTLTLSPSVGSVGTKSNGIRVLAYSKLEIKNGTVVCSSEAADNVKVGIANYSELTLDSVTMQAGDQTDYTINNRGALTLKGTTSVKEGSASVCAITNDPYNYYYTENVDASITCDSSSVSVDSVLVERYARDSANKGGVKLNISAGNFGELKEDGNSSVSTDYNVTGGTIAVSSTEELELALRAVKAGAAYSCPEKAVTIKLLQDISGSFDVGTSTGKAPKNIILDLDGKTLTLKPGVGSVGTKSNGIRVLAYSKLTVKNGTLACSNAVEDNVKVGIANYSQLRLDNVKVKAGDQTIYTINNRGKLDLTNGTEVENAKVPHGDYADSAELVAITNDPYGQCYTTPIDAELNCSDSSVKVGNVQLETYGKQGDIQLNITAGTFGEVHKPASSGSVDVKGNISGGKFASDVNDYCVEDYQVVKDSNNNYVVKKERTGFGFSDETFEVTFGQNGNKYQQVVANASGTVTYSILEGEDVATINSQTGELTIKKAGTVKVQALAEGNDQYHEAKATYTLVVKPAYAEVHSYSGGEITGSKTENTVITIAEATLQWCEKDESIGRNQDGWWVGIKIVAPDGVDLSKAIYQRRSGGTFDGAEVKPFVPDTDSDRYLSMWGLVTAEYLENFSQDGKKMNYVWRFSWDGDNVYEQTIAITIDPNGITLKQDGFGFSATSDTIIYGDNGNTYTPLVPTGGQAGTLKYSTSDDTIAKANEDGTLTILKAGEVTVTATLSGTHYEAIFASYTLTINKANQPAKFANATPAVTFNDNNNKFTQQVDDAQGDVTSYVIESELYDGQTADVADIDANTGELTIYQSGTVTVKATVIGNDNYLRGDVTYTLTINKDDQPAKFANATPAVKFNDNNNKFTQQVDDAQGTVTYDIESESYNGQSANVADINTTTGELTIYQSGTVTVKATVTGNECYLSGDVTYTLTVDKAEQSFTFNHGQSKDVTIKYGTSFTTVIDKSEKNSGQVSYVVSANTIGASVDEYGKVTFVDSAAKVGTVDVTVTLMEDVRYKPFSETYTVTVEYETVQGAPYSLGSGANAEGWYKTDVEIFAPADYMISFSNQLADNVWKDKVVWNTTDGEHDRWPQNGAPYICLKNTETGAITKKIYVSDLKRDTEKPKELQVIYETSWTEELLGKIFGFSSETVTVTVKAQDSLSGIGKMEYRLDGGTYTEIPLTNNEYKFEVPAQYAGQIYLKATDIAGNPQEYLHKDGEKIKVLVVDDVAPEVEIQFAGTRKDTVKSDASRETMNIFDGTTRYIYNGAVTVTIQVTEANFFKDVDLPVSVYRDGQLAVSGITSSDWVENNGKFVKTIVLEEDGDYQIKATYEDHSRKDMQWSSDEYAQTGTYTYTSNIHTVDTTKPVYEVTYDNNTVIQTVDELDYYAKARTATITVEDRNFRPSEVEFNVAAKDFLGQDVEYTYSKLNTWEDWTQDRENENLWTATVAMDADAKYTVDLNYKDLAENPIEAYYAEFVVDTTKPADLKVTYRSKDATILNAIVNAVTFGNYAAKQEVVLTMKDATSGVDHISLTVSPEGSDSATNLTMPENLLIKADGTVISGEKGFIKKIRSSLSSTDGTLALSFDVPAQFRGNVAFSAYDISGNLNDYHEDPGDFVVDTIAPGYTVSYNPSNVVNSKTMKDKTVEQTVQDITSTKDSYVMYFNKDATATITITEANFEGKQVTVQVLDAAGNVVSGCKQSAWKTTKAEGATDVHTKTVTISEEGDYRIKVFYQDRSMNTPVDYLSQRIVVDKTAPKIDVAYSNTDIKNTIDGRDYLDAKQIATVTITEHNFRPDDVVIQVTAKDVLGTDVLELTEDGYVKSYAQQGAKRSEWTDYEAGTWRREDDKFVLTLNYTADANYTFDIAYQDLATNEAADYQQDLFTVDTTAPKKLNVSYSTSIFEQIKQSITFGYYNAKMTVTIVAEDATSGIYHFAYSYINGEDVSKVNAELLNKAIKEAKITYEGKKATATFSIPKMVLGADNQFNGTVEFDAYDRSENSTNLKDSTVIVVDNIAPTSKITYSPPVDKENGISYYDGNINATIVINEANFDAKDVVVSVTKDGARFPVGVAWNDDNVDVHTGTFTLTKDGDYVVSVQYKDKSGNKMVNYTSNQLTVDKTKPTIKVSNIKANSANKDEQYGFVITVNDTNLDISSIKLALKAVQGDDGKPVDIDLGEAKTVVKDQTYTYTVKDLPEDGLYTLTCQVQDMSKNGTSEIALEDGKKYEQVQFSINRNGSTFGYGSQYSEELVEKYYIYSVDEDVVIVEVNVDPIEEYKITLNGEELVENTHYTTTQTSNANEWSKRTYTIKKSLFEAEGEYNIIVSSVDKAETTAYSDIKNLQVKFVVDQTKPVITITGMENSGRYRTDLQTVTIIPTDEGGRLNSISVVVLASNGTPLKDDAGNDISVRFEMAGEELLNYLEEQDGKITFTIPEGLNNQVKIICTDCATDATGVTNEYNELFERVTVSPNEFVIFYANTSLFVGSIVGVLAIIGLIIFLIKRRKAKKDRKA